MTLTSTLTPAGGGIGRGLAPHDHRLAAQGVLEVFHQQIQELRQVLAHGTTFVQDKLGEQIFAKGITIVEDPDEVLPGDR